MASPIGWRTYQLDHRNIDTKQILFKKNIELIIFFSFINSFSFFIYMKKSEVRKEKNCRWTR